MKTVFMLVNYTPDDLSIGITKKIRAQICALRNLGYQVIYTAYKSDCVAILDNNDQIVASMRYRFPSGSKLHGYFRYQDILTLANHYKVKSNVNFDYLYGRISAINKKYITLLKNFKKSGSSVIIEALAYFPGVKMRTIKGKYVIYCLETKKKKLCSLIDKIITEGQVEDFYGIPCEVGKIGIATDTLFKHCYNGDPNVLNMISVASEQAYHGYDRLIKSAAAYKCSNGSKSVRIHLVGQLSEATKSLVQKLEVEDMVILHGKMSGLQLQELYQNCNMGIGPLGQHRVGGKKDTGLKTKEYFGIGLPYFFSGCDEDVPDDYAYTYRVSSDEAVVDFDELWDFYLRYRDVPTVTEEMRAFAREVYSWDKIMQQALSLKKGNYE